MSRPPHKTALIEGLAVLLPQRFVGQESPHGQVEPLLGNLPGSALSSLMWSSPPDSLQFCRIRLGSAAPLVTVGQPASDFCVV